MPRLSAEECQAGMVLSEEVLDRQGRLLIPKGATLSAKHLGMLKTWGVAEVAVVGENDPPPGSGSTMEFPMRGLEGKGADAAVREMFKHTNMEHPLIKELMAEVQTRISKKGAGGGA